MQFPPPLLLGLGRVARRGPGSRAWLFGLGLLIMAGTAGPVRGGQLYSVGPTRAYRTLASLPALLPGDRVEIDPGTYNEVRRWTANGTTADPIVIRGVGASRPLFDATGRTVDGVLPNPRAVFQVEADHITIENLEFSNARNGDNGAGIRVTSGDHVTVRNCRITSCDMGIMSDHNDDLLIESSEIASNGTALYDGYSHNFYLGGGSAKLRFCWIHDSLYGQNVKSRSHYTELLYNFITDSQDGEVGLVDAAETTATNSHAVMIGNVVVSKPRSSGYNSGRFIQFGQDSGGAHLGTLFAFNNTFVAGDGRIQFLSANTGDARIVADNNVFHGSDKIVGTLGGGISGAHNFMPSTATVPTSFTATVSGTDPGFIDRTARDFHLKPVSPCRDQGGSDLSFLDGVGTSHSGPPTLEYVVPLSGRTRASDGLPDLGAFEWFTPAAFRLEGARSGNDLVLSFDVPIGTTGELQRTTRIGAETWERWLTNLPGGGPVQADDSNALSQPTGFYRAALWP